MAHVSIGPPDGKRLRESDRGQLLVVAGLVMAVSLVALVVLLNATIYSENVATRGIEAADGEATEVRAATVDGVGETIDAVNRANENNAAPTTGFLAGVDEFEERIGRSYAGRGGVIRLETGHNRTTNGTRIDTTGNDTSLANATGTGDYEFAGGVNRTRAFTLDIDIGELATATTASAADDAFHVVIDPDGNESREVYVYNGSDDVVVAVGDGGNEPTVVHEIDRDEVGNLSVDLTGEELNGSPYFDLWPSDRIDRNGSYSIRVANGDAANGTMRATVRPADPNGGTTTDVADDHVSGAVYDAIVDLSYRTAEIQFETTVRVAPGEPHA